MYGGTGFNDVATLTPSDSADLPRLTDAIWVGGAGIVTAVLQNGQTAAFTTVAGSLVPVRAKRVNATGTTATLLLALYQL